MKIFSSLPKLLMLRRGKRQKMRVTATRRPLRATAAEYDDMAEPNMRLSRALLIVLLLHVVAVSGIIAFNAIKTHQGPSISRPKNNGAVTAAKTASAAPSQNSDTASAKSDEVRSARAIGKSNPKERVKAADAGHAEEAHKSYTVGKGDSPVSIAKKFKVSYDELLALNHIDDPRKLKIGQKLLIPNKAPKGKKPGNE